MRGHEIDGLRRDLLRGHDEVAFVLAVRVIHDDDHAPGADVLDDAFDGIEGVLQGGGRRELRLSVCVHLRDEGKWGEGRSQLRRLRRGMALAFGPFSVKSGTVKYLYL